jgi:hypothetical protein
MCRKAAHQEEHHSDLRGFAGEGVANLLVESEGRGCPSRSMLNDTNVEVKFRPDVISISRSGLGPNRADCQLAMDGLVAEPGDTAMDLPSLDMPDETAMIAGGDSNQTDKQEHINDTNYDCSDGHSFAGGATVRSAPADTAEDDS